MAGTFAQRIGAGMLAFAAGDALGVPWEGMPPDAIDPAAVPALPATRVGWPRGATSDDTAQMLLVADLLAESGGRPTAEGFMARLADAAEAIRGIGPTTSRSLARYRTTGSLPERDPEQRPTNGAAMRMLPAGWATPAADAERRHGLVHVLAVGTHQAPESIAAACVVAAMAAAAVEEGDVGAALAAASSELVWANRRYAPLPAVAAALDGHWRPPAAGVSLDSDETTAAVVWVVRSTSTPSRTLSSALLDAVLLGGDTDTVAALAGGVVGSCLPQEVGGLAWLGLIDVGPRPDLARRLSELRDGHPQGRPGNA